MTKLKYIWFFAGSALAVAIACNSSNPRPNPDDDDDDGIVPDDGKGGEKNGTGGRASGTGGRSGNSGGQGGDVIQPGTGGGSIEPPPDRNECPEEPDDENSLGPCWNLTDCNGVSTLQFLNQCGNTCIEPFDQSAIEGFTGELPPLN